jgi:UDP-N-acetylglucosamine 1-carboxyvinyltransferase
MGALGVFCELNNSELFIDARKITQLVAPYEHVKKMRASFYVLGPLVARYGEAKVSLPGGCAWGPRPVDLHIKGIEKLGAEITLDQGYVIAKSKGRLQACKFHFDISSVGATGNVLMAATLAKGTTVLTNCAIEPEITALAKMLTKMGAKIEGIGTTELIIEGVDELKPVNEETIPDRIEAATYLIAAAMTMGEIQLENVNPYHLTSVISKLEEAGCEIDINSNKIFLKADAPPKPVDLVTAVYPGIPTDIQAQWTAYMLTAEGTSKVTDNIYQDRFKHVPELMRLGAKIDVVDNAAIISGGERLSGATVMSSDLRGSASLILAALVAKGTTEVLRIYHLDRGYDNIEQKLKKLGAVIERHQTELI